MVASILRIRQKGYSRSTGFQLVSWAVTVPVADPGGTPLLATSPTNYQPMFVIRNNGHYESLVRVATASDLGTIPHQELRYLDVRGPGGDVLFAPLVAGGPVGPWAGDEILFDTVSQVPHWLEDEAPYASGVYVVKETGLRTLGAAPQALPGGQLVLPGYTFTSSDVGRWVYLVGFLTAGNNGLAQILAINGNVATVNKPFGTTQTGGAWAFPWVSIDTRVDPSVEPQYFPTKESNIGWSLRRGGVIVASQPAGAFTLRGTESTLIRSTRFTGVLPNAELAKELGAVIRNGVYNLSLQAQTLDTEFLPLTTSTFGA